MKNNNLLKRYYRGETSLQEEQALKQASRRGELPEEPSLAFQGIPSEIPPELLARIHVGVRQRIVRRNRQYRITAISVAAMMLLIISMRYLLPPANVPDIRLSELQKKEHFENALRVIGNVLEEKKSPDTKVLYEDDQLIIAVE